MDTAHIGKRHVHIEGGYRVEGCAQRGVDGQSDSPVRLRVMDFDADVNVDVHSTLGHTSVSRHRLEHIWRAGLRQMRVGLPVGLVSFPQNPDSLCRVAVMKHQSAVKDKYTVAQRADLVGRVTYQDDGAALALELGDLLHALELERLVSHREHFVDK